MDKNTDSTKDKKDFLDLNNSRTEKQKVAMTRIIEGGYDPFLRENILKEHEKPILKETKHWFVTENQWAYTNSKKQILFITQTYMETLEELSGEAFKELLQLVKEICTEFDIKGGALCGRFGDTKISGATVKHLHFQVIESDTEKGAVLFCIGDFNKKSEK
jgi:diadenosine tetraphosphate (Ap4A) HIT family hydrolase